MATAGQTCIVAFFIFTFIFTFTFILPVIARRRSATTWGFRPVIHLGQRCSVLVPLSITQRILFLSMREFDCPIPLKGLKLWLDRYSSYSTLCFTAVDKVNLFTLLSRQNCQGCHRKAHEFMRDMCKSLKKDFPNENRLKPNSYMYAYACMYR